MRPRSLKRQAADRAYEPVRLAVLERDDHRCLICGRTAGDVHHRKQKSLGGSDNPVNLVSLCRSCHSDVHDHPEIYRPLGYLLWGWEPEDQVAVWHNGLEAWVMPSETDTELIPLFVALMLPFEPIERLGQRLAERDRLFTLVHDSIPWETT